MYAKIENKSFSTSVKDNRADYEIKRYRDEKEKAQHDYCLKAGIPIFMPKTCYSCGKNVVDFYSLSECLTGILTGCRNCNKSFVS